MGRIESSAWHADCDAVQAPAANRWRPAEPNRRHRICAFGDILDEEFEQEELEPLLQFLRAFMDGLKGDDATAQKTIDTIAAKHGKKTIEDWLKRFEALSPETEKTCKFKF